MEYSEYSLEQLKQNSNFEKLCSYFFNLAKDKETYETLQSILYKGGIEQYSFSAKMPIKNNPEIEMKRRFSMAYLFITEPQTFKFFVDNNINLFHGTNASVVPDILKYGLNSVDELNKQGIEISTGEDWSRIGGKRNFVSFTDVYDIAEGYAEMSTKEDTPYSAIIGTTASEIRKHGTVSVASDVSEVCVKNSFSKESIKCICVDTDNIDEFKNKIANYQVPVLKIPKIDDKFYYIDDMSQIYINEDKYEKLVNKNKAQEIKRLTNPATTKDNTNSISNLRKTIDKFKDIIKDKTTKTK